MDEASWALIESSANHLSRRRTGSHPSRRAEVKTDGKSVATAVFASSMKRIGFLSFGHWTPSPHSQTRSASDALLQSIDLAVAAEELGADGAYFRVHHFANQLASPFPLLAAVGARTSRIEIGTGRDRHALREPALHGRGRRRRRPHLGWPPAARHQPWIARAGHRGLPLLRLRARRGQDDADMAREHTRVFLEVISGEGFAEPNPRPMFANPPGPASGRAATPRGCASRIWWGAGTRKTAEWTAEQGMNLMSSTLLSEDTGVPFHQLQAEQIERFRKAWADAGHAREPRVSVSRSIFPIVNDLDRAVLRQRGPLGGPGRVHRRRHRPLRQDLRRRARAARRAAGRRTRRSPPPTPCC